MKRLFSVLAVPATLFLALSVEAADKQLEVGISTFALSAPCLLAPFQPVTLAAENLHVLAAGRRSIR
jgi:hypothetical protein